MNKVSWILVVVSLALLSGSAFSQDGGRRRGESRPGGQIRERILKRFDRDGDGKLNRRERHALRKFVREHRRDRGTNDRPQRDRNRPMRRRAAANR